MSTCLTCPTDKMYNVVCNFSIGINHYACDPQTTCMRADGTYDCCAKNIVSCIVDAASLLVPTVQPTAVINESSCEAQRCAAKYTAGHCYWYENVNRNIMCSKDDTEYCCSHDREDCCQTSKTMAVVVFSSVACLLIVFVCYRYITRSYSKIIPVTVEPLDRYELTKSKGTPNIV